MAPREWTAERLEAARLHYPRKTVDEPAWPVGAVNLKSARCKRGTKRFRERLKAISKDFTAELIGPGFLGRLAAPIAMDLLIGKSMIKELERSVQRVNESRPAVKTEV